MTATPRNRTLGLVVLAIAGIIHPFAPAQTHPVQPRPVPTPSVAITIDDLPAVDTTDAAVVTSINLALLNAFDRHHAPATGFVIGQIADLTPQSLPMLREWKRRGYDIGNHTWSHLSYADTPIPQEEFEILHGQQAIAPFLVPGRNFVRFPYNSIGETKEKHEAIMAFLKSHHLQLATCTIENEDWVFEDAYAKALSLKDKPTAARIRQAYLDYTAAEIDFYANLHRQIFGREIPLVMLMHANLLNADTISQVLDLFATRHYRFITLTQAQSDPAYATPDTDYTDLGPMWGYRWAKSLGLHLTGPKETEPPDWITRYGADSPSQ
jgi:peptidoglycan/xylan/chitin deacetylase (PgdA/CDA1 family)